MKDDVRFFALRMNFSLTWLVVLVLQGWKSVVCGFWTSPLLFMVRLAFLNGVLVALVILYRRKCSKGSVKQRMI